MEQGAVTLVDCTLRADLRGMIALGGKWCMRAGWGRGLEGVVEGCLCSVPLICVF